MEEYFNNHSIEGQEALIFPEDITMEPVIKKKSGKQKIEIKPIIKKTTKQVTFTKRRNGLFKKASELCSSCGSEVAVIAFSPAGKLFSFGHPNADSVVHRYVNYTQEGLGNNNNIGNCSNINEGSIKVEKEKTDNVSLSSSNVSNPRGGDTYFGFWWDKPIDDLGLSELEKLKAALQGLRDEISSRVNGCR